MAHIARGTVGSRVLDALTVAALIVILGTSAWTIREVGKNNRAIYQLSERGQAFEAARQLDAARASERSQAFETARNVDVARAFDVLNAKVDRLKSTTISHEHSDVRRFMIAGHLARAANPIVVLGDSITEAADLPEMICGHVVVNAGIGGAGVDDLLAVAPSLLEGKALALVVIAIGINDAFAAEGQETRFSASYATLLQSLASVAPKLAVANIPPVAPNAALTKAAHLDAGLIDRFNLLLPDLAKTARASFIDLHEAVTAKGQPETLDGVHLAPSAYELWDAAMLAGINKALDCTGR
ncbi:GDSL-type esterase/lipase family protein [Bradyrhizobium sp. Arg816]|uniref:SGNH/GDSL hydrolase family protein n=1 Tax=Bradyrhizobium sp. Arg816 TaxID=2998491 RepID=UPI00249F894A|nr:GDSL-type esterase/lipase family protein [Bradyrhizobium sp. Arg816]MDI3563937.1 GDSL-type esterase/lipase family protein [Bradyrhizobium sp. Arg816]